MSSMMIPRSRSGVSMACLRFQSGDAFDAQLLDGDGSARAVTRVARHARDFVGHLLAFDDLAKNGVPIVKPRRCRHGDEKLAAVGVRAGVGHGKKARFGMLQRGTKLISELVAWPTHPAAVRATALNHELRDDAVKTQPVIERPLFLLACLFVGEFLRAFSQPHEIGYRFGCFFLIQPYDNIPLLSLKNGVGSYRSAHAFSLYNASAESSYTSHTAPRHSAGNDVIGLRVSRGYRLASRISVTSASAFLPACRVGRIILHERDRTTARLEAADR